MDLGLGHWRRANLLVTRSSTSSDLTSVTLKQLGGFTFNYKDNNHEPFPASAPGVSRARLCCIRRHCGETFMAMPIAIARVAIGRDRVCHVGTTRASAVLLE